MVRCDTANFVLCTSSCVTYRVPVVHEHDEGVGLSLIDRGEDAHAPAEKVL